VEPREEEENEVHDVKRFWKCLLLHSSNTVAILYAFQNTKDEDITHNNFATVFYGCKMGSLILSREEHKLHIRKCSKIIWT
jgi:hypothetical protein